jgi:PKD repeat protein
MQLLPRTLRHTLALATLTAAFNAFAQNAPVTVNVDANASRHPISPFVYGVAYGDATTLVDLNAPLNRYGGNNTSRYNWQQNADNRGFDWYFESLGDASSTPGERGNTFISMSRNAGAQPMVTVPMTDWVAKLGPNRSKLASFSQSKYGAQTGNDAQWFPDAGNGVLKSTGADIVGNDPADANEQNTPALEQNWVSHIVSTFGTAASGGLRFYILDNEPSIWHSTHRDVHPSGATMEEIRNKTIDYAKAIRAVDASAVIVGPEEWGWSGYFYSGYDQQYGAAHNWCCFPDRQTHGNWDYLPWFLDQLRQKDAQSGQRSLDVFSAHFYPQGGEFSDDVSTAMQLRRNQSTRALWDPNYLDATWINDKVKLIPRIKSWVSTYYPGLATAITEYNWGAEAHINGATTQADILGIFGREGLDYAARWTTPGASTPTYKAMKMYRNYDGNRSTFGDTSVLATVPNPDTLSAFAALRSTDGSLTIMIVSKALSGSTPVTVNLANFASSGFAQPWQLTSANTITRLSDVAVNGSSVSIALPPQSVTLLVLPGGTPNSPPTAVATAAPTAGTAPLVVNFNGAGSYDSDGSVTAYQWTFGDGGTASGAAASHTYASAGAYSAKLTVTDNRGATASQTIAINVSQGASEPNAPSGLTASAAKRGSVTLRWTDNANNEQGFYIERAVAGTTNYARIGQAATNVTTFSQSGVASGQYAYRVQAYNGSMVSSYSNVATVRVK